MSDGVGGAAAARRDEEGELGARCPALLEAPLDLPATGEAPGGGGARERPRQRDHRGGRGWRAPEQPSNLVVPSALPQPFPSLPHRARLAPQHAEHPERLFAGGEERAEHAQRRAQVAFGHRAGELEDIAETLLTHHRADLGRGHAAVVRPTGQGGLGHLPQQQGQVVPDELDEQRGRRLLHLETARGRAGAQPGHQRAAGEPRERDHRGGRQRLEQPVARRHLGIGEEQEHGGGIRRGGVHGEGLPLPHAERVGAAHHHQPALGEERQREGRPHDGFRTRLAGLEDFARKGGGVGIGEERAGDGRHRVVEEHRLGAVEENEGRRAARLHRAEQPRVVH